MSPQTTHPLVDAYLRDLELLLRGVEPSERAEVLAGVREHLDGRLGADARDADVRQALDALGPPQHIADEAYAGRSTTSAPPVPTWHAITATGVNAVGLAFASLLLLVRPHPSEFLFIGWIYALPWLLAVATSAMSPAWRTLDKAASILLFPLVVICLAVMTGILQATLGAGHPGTYVVPVVVLLGGAWALVSLLRRALR